MQYTKLIYKEFPSDFYQMETSDDDIRNFEDEIVSQMLKEENQSISKLKNEVTNLKQEIECLESSLKKHMFYELSIRKFFSKNYWKKFFAYDDQITTVQHQRKLVNDKIKSLCNSKIQFYIKDQMKEKLKNSGYYLHYQNETPQGKIIEIWHKNI